MHGAIQFTFMRVKWGTYLRIFNLSLLWFAMCFLIRLYMYAIFTHKWLEIKEGGVWEQQLCAWDLFFSLAKGFPCDERQVPWSMSRPHSCAVGQVPASRASGESCLYLWGSGGRPGEQLSKHLLPWNTGKELLLEDLRSVVKRYMKSKTLLQIAGGYPINSLEA